MVAMVGYYGLVTSDTMAGGIIAAFWFATIAIGGIGGPAIAVHLFRASRGWAKTWGVIAGIVAVVALVVNLSNSLGAIAGRADRTLATRIQAKDASKDAREDLRRLTKEREALIFTPAAGDDVEAAKAAVTAAEQTREAECSNGRGRRHCKSKEAAEQSARAALAAVLSNKAMSDRATKLDQDIATTRSRLERSPAVASVDPRAELVARIFSVGPDTVATAQQIATVVVVELLIAFALIARELLAAPEGGRRDGGSDRDAALSMDTAAQRVDSEASADVDGSTPATKPERLPLKRPSQTRERTAKGRRLGPSGQVSKSDAGQRIVDTLHAQGGRIEKASVRGIAALIGVRKSTVHNALLGLISAGVVSKAAGGTLMLATG